jgi:hypothetical protein
MDLVCLGIGNVPGINPYDTLSLTMHIEHNPLGFFRAFMEDKLKNFYYKFPGSVIIIEKHYAVIFGLLEFLFFFRQYLAFALYPGRHNNSFVYETFPKTRLVLGKPLIVTGYQETGTISIPHIAS